MFSRRQRFVRLLCVVNDVLVTVVALLVAHAVRSQLLPLLLPGRSRLYPLHDYIPFILTALILFPGLALLLGTREARLADKAQSFRDSFMIVAIGSVGLAAVLYVLRAEYVSRSFVILFATCECTLLFAARLWMWPGRWKPTAQQRRFLIVGVGESARQLAARLLQGPLADNHIIGFIDPGMCEKCERPDAIPVFTTCEAYGLLSSEVVDEVHFAVNKEELAELELLMLRCQQQGIQVRLCLDFLPRTVSHVYLEHLHDIPLLTLSNTPDNDWLLFIKRLLDVLIAAAALVVIAPFLALIAVLVGVTSKGPILFKQTRCGLGGRHFTLLKFRSMVLGADAMQDGLEQHNQLDGPVFKMTDDPRCTVIGRWLRRWSIDELPQLWNVLRGDMSLVGPRPPIPTEVAQYETWHHRRLRMRPGLTCLWVVEGRNAVKFERWMQLDIDYIENWSLWLDMKILFQSIPVVLSGRGAY